MSPPSLPCIALAGPTASGKTATALALAAHAASQWGLRVEIISVDSALVYRGMDVGTAKPAAHEQAQAPHHLIDILDPAESYSAARFVRDAQRLIGAIRQRGHLPVLVGGTMLYFKALFEGLNTLPQADPALRTQIAHEALCHGWPALHARLAEVDPATAARLPAHDSQRIGRALEVWHLTGKPLSHWHAQPADRALPGTPAALLLSLEPSDRAWLHTRIAQRFDAMLHTGFIDEVQRLRQRGDLHAGLPSIRCVGYRQAWEAMDNGTPLPIWREQAIAATRQLAKRQLTWLRSMPQRHAIACDQGDPAVQVLAQVARLLQTVA